MGGSMPTPPSNAPIVQLFGYEDSQPTRAALRFFKERRVVVHFVDLKQRPIAAGELRRFTQKLGAANLLVPHQFGQCGGKSLRRAGGAQEFGDKRPAQDQVDQINLSHLQHPVEHLLGQRIKAVGDDHRQSGERQL